MGQTERASGAAVLEAWAAAHRARVLALAGLLLAATLLLGAYTTRHGALPGEAGLYRGPLGVPGDSVRLADASRYLVDLGDPAVALVIVCAVAGLALLTDGLAGAAMVVAAAGAVVVADLMKRAAGEQSIQALPPVAHFPSGHVTFVAAVFGMAAALAAAGRRGGVAACCVVPVVAIGPAVLVQGGHVASDVAGAYGLAAAWILACLVAVERAHRASWWP